MNKIEEYFFNRFLYPKEEIEYIIHRHPWALFSPLLKVTTFGILMPLLLGWVFAGEYMIYVSSLWLLIGIAYFVYEFVDWYYDVILLTTENILDIEWKGLFHKTANRINYDNVEGVSYKIEGAIPTLFKFGDLSIQTMSEGEKGLGKTSNVREVQKTILNKRDEIVTKKSESDTEVLKKAMKAIIAGEMGQEIDEEAVSTEPDQTEMKGKPVIILETKEIKDGKDKKKK